MAGSPLQQLIEQDFMNMRQQLGPGFSLGLATDLKDFQKLGAPDQKERQMAMQQQAQASPGPGMQPSAASQLAGNRGPIDMMALQQAVSAASGGAQGAPQGMPQGAPQGGGADPLSQIIMQLAAQQGLGGLV